MPRNLALPFKQECPHDDARSRVDCLNQLAHRIFFHDANRSLTISKTAEREAREANYDSGLALSLLQQAYYNQQNSHNELALRQLLEILPLLQELGKAEHEANALKLLGEVYLQTGNFSEALAYHQDALQIAETLTNPKIAGSIHISIGRALSELRDHQTALDHFTKALEIMRAVKEGEGEAVCLNNLAFVNLRQERYDKALKCARQALAIADAIPYKPVQIYAHDIIGNVYSKQQRFEAAVEHYKQSLKIAQEIGHRYARADTLYCLAKVTFDQKRIDAALEFCASAETAARAIDAKHTLRDVYLLLAEIHADRDDMRKAYHYHKIFHEVDCSVLNAKARTTGRLLRLQFEIDRSLKETEIHRLKNVELASALGQLEDANRDLQRLNTEKNEFLSIAAHELLGPLSTIETGTLNIVGIAQKIKQNKILGNAQRIQRVYHYMRVLISNLLDVNRIESLESRLVAEYVDWGPIVQQTLDLLRSEAQRKEIVVKADIPSDEVVIHADAGVLPRVSYNLISNALKFSAPGSAVYVRLDRRSAKARLQIQDEGPGLSEEDKSKLFTAYAQLSARPTAGESSHRIGLASVKKIVDSMAGSIWCESEYGKGACFTVEFALASDAAGD